MAQMPEIIAEIGLNHGGSVEAARDLIDAAVDAGADTVKFQTYLPEERVDRGHALWDVFDRAALTPEETQALAEYSRSAGVGFLSTAFGEWSIQLLNELKLDRVKIASFSITHETLISQALECFDQVLISTGTASRHEIERVLSMQSAEGAQMMLLHCMSSYPTANENANLCNLPMLRELSGAPVGYSDHTVGFESAAYATLLGAEVIEKHFTLSKQSVGPDHAISAEPSELAELVSACRTAASMWGSERGSKPYECEEAILPFKVRSSLPGGHS